MSSCHTISGFSRLRRGSRTLTADWGSCATKSALSTCTALYKLSQQHQPVALKALRCDHSRSRVSHLACWEHLHGNIYSSFHSAVSCQNGDSDSDQGLKHAGLPHTITAPAAQLMSEHAKQADKSSNVKHAQDSPLLCVLSIVCDQSRIWAPEQATWQLRHHPVQLTA